jgi:hypothetical protein
MRNCTRQKGVMKDEKLYETKGGMKEEKWSRYVKW